MRKLSILTVPALALMLAVAGCATAGDSGARVSGNTITREHLDGMEHLSVYDALLRLKPTWIRSPRYARMQVYMDGLRRGGRSSLRDIGSRNVEEIRFLDGRAATTEFGTDHESGALIILTQR